MFGLHFEIIENTSVWDPTVIVINIKNEIGVLYGFLYLDLIYRENKPVQPLCITLSHNYEYNNIKRVPILSIIAGYKSLTTPAMAITDVVCLFKQFGQVIHHISNKSKYGLYNIDNDFNELIPRLMEFIVWDKNIIKRIWKDIDDESIEKLIISRRIELIYNLRNSCIDGLFDNLMHTSPIFIKFYKTLIKEKDANKIETT